MTDDPRSWLTLVRAPGLGPNRLRPLLQRYTSAAALLAAGAGPLRQAGLPQPTIDAVLRPDEAVLESDLRWLSQPGHHLLWPGHERYPRMLEETGFGPTVLFAKGDVRLLDDPQLAIVGSRNPTATGKETATAFASHLAAAGLVITSGLARGIDTAAHRGALAVGGPTIAVCATGLDVVYPRENAGLAAEIADQGLLISELPPGVTARRELFPQRNRLIAGCSIGTLVVEAASRSGSLITAHRAVEAGREVFAIPGSIHSPLSRGCHILLREGAKMVETADDVLTELAPQLRAAINTATPHQTIERADNILSDEYHELLQLVGYEPTPVDTVVRRSGLTTQEVSSMLLILELHGFIKPSSQGGYTRTTTRPQE